MNNNSPALPHPVDNSPLLGGANKIYVEETISMSMSITGEHFWDYYEGDYEGIENMLKEKFEENLPETTTILKPVTVGHEHIIISDTILFVAIAFVRFVKLPGKDTP